MAGYDYEFVRRLIERQRQPALDVFVIQPMTEREREFKELGRKLYPTNLLKGD